MGAGLHRVFKATTGVKGYDLTGRDGGFFTCLGITPWPRGFSTGIEYAEAGQFYLFISFQTVRDFFEKSLNHLLGFPLVKANAVDELFSEICFGEGHG